MHSLAVYNNEFILLLNEVESKNAMHLTIIT